jgi:hypothetical protein
MKHVVNLIAIGIVALVGLSVLTQFAAIALPNFARGGQGIYWVAAAPRNPSVFMLLASVVVVALILRWAFGRPQHNTPVEVGKHSEPTPESANVEQLVRDLDRTARNLEKRLESLETILLDRTRTPL